MWTRLLKHAVLYNYLTVKKDLPLLYNQLNPGGDPYLGDNAAIIDLNPTHGYHSPAAARGIRDIYKAYFTSPQGAVTWQGRAIVS